MVCHKDAELQGHLTRAVCSQAAAGWLLKAARSRQVVRNASTSVSCPQSRKELSSDSCIHKMPPRTSQEI